MASIGITEEQRHLLRPTTDIPLIITSTNSSPDATWRQDLNKEEERKSIASKSEEPLLLRKDSMENEDDGEKGGKRRESRNVGGSLKYEIGRNKSASNLINLPAKWSSVRIKGTGYYDSRKSVVKIEPCNGIPNILTKDYGNLKSPNSSTGTHMKSHNIGNVSRI